ncbi:unnamed protein product [Parascedosporium putredinis]|uniref:Myb-like domain-containing protein n=1 Tax=Parascedosporium putredinis TaxID=1442378 RepID=A0A9P1GUK7_9PEZI|nr:unnamed protein product [Parascedosporium putredinis]CAI7987618.1 unnamed protein product [Parascedosporium putredinis]
MLEFARGKTNKLTVLEHDAEDPEEWNSLTEARHLLAESSEPEAAPKILRRKRSLGTAALDIPHGRLPYKRVPGIFNLEYLGLLNEDIDDAKENIIAQPDPTKLLATQIGMVTWSATEKQLFFEGVGRLGKENLPGIAARIQTKSILEVAQYIQLLEKEVQANLARPRDTIITADIPAAMEISPQCCLALDAMADEMSLRQQRYEEKQEQQKWEEFPWVVSQSVASEMEENPDAYGEPFTKLFHLPTWLSLSDQVFMNASFPESNWLFVDEEPPSDLVKTRDVLAAVDSLGLSRDSSQFWANCPRRLKLDVFDDEGLYDYSDEQSGAEDGADGPPILSFADAEEALGLKSERLSDASSEPESDGEDRATDSEKLGDKHTADDSDADEEDRALLGAVEESLSTEIGAGDKDLQVQLDARELLIHTALDIPSSTRTVEAVKRRILVEMNHEAYADACDEVASANEELKLWEILRLEPPAGLAARTRAVEPIKREMTFTDAYLNRDEWRKSIKYVSDWEANAADANRSA